MARGSFITLDGPLHTISKNCGWCKRCIAPYPLPGENLCEIHGECPLDIWNDKKGCPNRVLAKDEKPMMHHFNGNK